MGRKLLIAIVAILVVLGALYAIGWRIAGEAAKQALAQSEDRLRAKGLVLTHEPIALGGFPFALSLSTQDLHAKWPSGLELFAPRARATVDAFDPLTPTLRASRGVIATLPAGANRPVLHLFSGDAHGSAALTLKRQVERVTLEARDLAVAEAENAEAALKIGSASIEAIPAPDAPAAALTKPVTGFSLILRQVMGAHWGDTPLGPAIEQLVLEANPTGPPLAGFSAAALSAWRDAGGTLEVKRLGLVWGPAEARMDGTLALDRELQPEGAFSLALTGYDAVLDALAASGQMKPNAAALAKAGMGMLAKPERPNGPPVLKVPFSIQNRGYYLSSFKLGSFQKIPLD